GSGFSEGGFARTRLLGIGTHRGGHALGIPLNLLDLFAIAHGVIIVLVIAAFVVFGWLGLLRCSTRFDSKAALHVDLESEPPLPGHHVERQKYSAWSKSATETQSSGVMVEESAATSKMSGVQIVTVVCMLGLIASVITLAAIGLEPDIGVLCFVFATVLTLVDPRTGRNAVSKIDWSTILMVGGIITFVGVLEHMGA